MGRQTGRPTPRPDTVLLLDDAGSVGARAGALACAFAVTGDHGQADAVVALAEKHLDRAPVLEQSHTRHLISLVRDSRAGTARQWNMPMPR